jgi:hypothetical protein
MDGLMACIYGSSVHAKSQQRSPKALLSRNLLPSKNPRHRSRGRALGLPCPHHTIPAAARKD